VAAVKELWIGVSFDDAAWRDAYPSVTYDKVRYADTDRQGHVNNAVFATFLETGRVEIGTRVARVGTSSLTIEQGLFQDDRRVASAETVIVQIDTSTRKSAPLAPEAVARLERLTSP
jgi:acyl-CoA thioester hydrolase